MTDPKIIESRKKRYDHLVAFSKRFKMEHVVGPSQQWLRERLIEDGVLDGDGHELLDIERSREAA